MLHTLHVSNDHHCSDLHRSAGAADSNLAEHAASKQAEALAVAAVHAWGWYVRLLGSHFLDKTSRVQALMLEVCCLCILCYHTSHLHLVT